MQIKDGDVRDLIASIKGAQSSLPEIDRIDIDTKVEALRTQFMEMKNAIQRRIELATNYVRVLQLAEKLSDRFKHVEAMLSSTPDDAKLTQFKIHWDQIKPAYAELKRDAAHFLTDATKVNSSLACSSTYIFICILNH